MVAQGNLVLNGDFSDPTSDPDADPYPLPSLWTVTPAIMPSGVAVVRVPWGVFSVDYMFFGIYDTGPSGATLTLEQPIDLPAGQYRLSFNFNFTTNGPVGPGGLYESDTFRVLLNGDPHDIATNHSQPVDFSVDYSDPSNPYTLTFTQGHSAPGFVLGFQFDRNIEMGDVWTELALDNVDLSEVQVPAVPVPGAVLLGAVGLSCAGWRLRRGRS
jgi:hypothetical protein